MSYRALVTIIDNNTVTSTGPFERSSMVFLGDTWGEGESLAELLGEEKTFNLALKSLGERNTEGRSFAREFTTAEERRDWSGRWADETWDVAFTQAGEDTLVHIHGRDASGTVIFYRRTLRG